MKILFFINKLYGGGAERVATILMNHLCEKYTVCAVVFDNNDQSYQISNRISVYKISVNNRLRIIRLIKRIREIRNKITRESPDIIISFLTPINLYVIISNLFIGRKTIISERNTLNRVQSKFVRLLRKIIYPLADRIVFVTKADCVKFGLKQKSLFIYNPSMLETFSDYSHRQKKIITIAPTSRWYNKGLDILLKTWAKISARNPDWHLEILGVNNLTELPTHIRQTQKILWLGWTNNVRETLQTKSIFVLASRFEGCPNSLIEAMSQGCACLITDCDGGMKEMITDNVDGLIAESENIDDLAVKLQLMIDDECLRRRLSAGAIEKISKFDKNAFFANWDNLIEEVAIK